MYRRTQFLHGQRPTGSVLLLNQTNEQFYLDYIDSTTFRVRSRSSGKCLNNGASTADGTAVIQYLCGSYTNENFRTVPIATTGYAYLSAVGSFNEVEIPTVWNGFGYVPSSSNGAKLVEGTVAGEDDNAGLLWCKTLSSCSTKP